MNRPSWDAIWMQMAGIIARRSRCARSQVGAVLITSDNRVEAAGYNGPPAKWTPNDDLVTTWLDMKCDSGWCPRAATGGGPAYYDDCVTSHAEMNALIMSDRSRYEGATLYVTRCPCYTCAKVIANSGVKRVVICVSEDDSNREPERSIGMLERSGVLVVRWI